MLPPGFTPNRVNAICRAWPRWHEWGHWLSLLLAACFITKRRWGWLQWKLGLVEVPQCGCASREAWLNTLGGKLCASTRWWARLAAWMLVRRPPPA